LKGGVQNTQQIRQDFQKERGDRSRLSAARKKLRILVRRARRSLRKAEARPFSTSAVSQVVKMRNSVKTMKDRVVRLAGAVKGDVKLKKMDMKQVSGKSGKKIAKKAKKRVAKLTKKTKKYSLKHPDLKHMTRKQIKYWANKRLKWRSFNPLKKTRIMQKVFALKQQEAATLTKMNELNTRIGMKTKGIRAAMLRKGETAIVNGQLIKPKANFHIQSTFQGKKIANKGRSSLLNPPTRDTRTDSLKKYNKSGLKSKMKKITRSTAKQLARAKSAAIETGKVAHKKHKSTFGLKTLKKGVIKNKSLLKLPKGDLGDDDSGDDESELSTQDDAFRQHLEEDEAEDAKVDNDADIAMDALDTSIDASDVDNSRD